MWIQYKARTAWVKCCATARVATLHTDSWGLLHSNAALKADGLLWARLALHSTLHCSAQLVLSLLPTWKSLSMTGRRSASDMYCSAAQLVAAATASLMGPWQASWMRLRMSDPE